MVPASSVPAVTSAIEAARPAPLCSGAGSRYAIITVQPGGQEFYVALGGCRVVWARSPKTLRVPDPSIFKLLAHLQ
jgi:hypothetical protein